MSGMRAVPFKVSSFGRTSDKASMDDVIWVAAPDGRHGPFPSSASLDEGRDAAPDDPDDPAEDGSYV